MAAFSNALYWIKSYLIEFLVEDVPKYAFTFAVPPQSEEFEFPQRINETKTFGGAVISDYGNDMVKINLSGNTINNELKLIFKSIQGVEPMSGEDEIFFLRDKLREWGSLDSLILPGSRKVMLYELKAGIKTKVLNHKYWEVFPTNFSIKRNKDRPLSYDYQIQFTANPEPGLLKYQNVASSIINAALNLNSVIESVTSQVNATLEVLKAVVSWYQSLEDVIEKVKSASAYWESVAEEFQRIINRNTEENSFVVKDEEAIGNLVIKEALRLQTKNGDKLYYAATKLNEAVKMLHDFFDKFEEKYKKIADGLLNVYGKDVESEEVLDVYKDVVNDLSAKTAKCVAIAKILNDKISAVCIPGDLTEDDNLMTTYGYKTVIAKESDTWDSLAKEHYGNSDYGAIIALYTQDNGDSSELSVGAKIIIPKIEETGSSVLLNQVYNEPGFKDNYGKDLKIGKDKDLGVYLGDLSTINNQDNLSQAILNRLATELNSRVRDEVYGIRTKIGDSNKIAASFIIASIEQTVKADPRIKNINSIKWKGTGDSIAIDIDYTDINEIQQNIGGIV